MSAGDTSNNAGTGGKVHLGSGKGTAASSGHMYLYTPDSPDGTTGAITLSTGEATVVVLVEST